MLEVFPISNRSSVISLSISCSKGSIQLQMWCLFCVLLFLLVEWHPLSSVSPGVPTGTMSVIYYFCFSLRIPEIFLYAVKSIVLGHIFQRTVFLVTWAAILTKHLRESFIVCKQPLSVPLSNAACTHHIFFFY